MVSGNIFIHNFESSLINENLLPNKNIVSDKQISYYINRMVNVEIYFDFQNVLDNVVIYLDFRSTEDHWKLFTVMEIIVISAIYSSQDPNLKISVQQISDFLSSSYEFDTDYCTKNIIFRKVKNYPFATVKISPNPNYTSPLNHPSMYSSSNTSEFDSFILKFDKYVHACGIEIKSKLAGVRESGKNLCNYFFESEIVAMIMPDERGNVLSVNFGKPKYTGDSQNRIFETLLFGAVSFLTGCTSEDWNRFRSVATNYSTDYPFQNYIFTQTLKDNVIVVLLTKNVNRNGSVISNSPISHKKYNESLQYLIQLNNAVSYDLIPRALDSHRNIFIYSFSNGINLITSPDLQDNLKEVAIILSSKLGDDAYWRSYLKLCFIAINSFCSFSNQEFQNFTNSIRNRRFENDKFAFELTKEQNIIRSVFKPKYR